jgi:hypothetical protein
VTNPATKNRDRLHDAAELLPISQRS